MSIEEHPDLAELLIDAEEPVADVERYRKNLEIARRAGYGVGFRDGRTEGFSAGVASTRDPGSSVCAGCGAVADTFLPPGWFQYDVVSDGSGDIASWCPTCDKKQKPQLKKER